MPRHEHTEDEGWDTIWTVSIQHRRELNNKTHPQILIPLHHIPIPTPTMMTPPKRLITKGASVPPPRTIPLQPTTRASTRALN